MLHAVPADEVDGAGGADDGPTVRADPAAAVAFGASCGSVPAAGRSVSAADLDLPHVGAVHGDLPDVVVENPGQEEVGRLRVAPSVGLRAGHVQQSGGFCCSAEEFVVVGPPTAAILDVQDFVVHLMHHFMDHRGHHILDRAGKGPGCDVDLVASVPAFCGPDGGQAVVTIGSAGALDGDDGADQRAAEKVFVQLVI